MQLPPRGLYKLFNMAAAQLERILANLLVPDNTVIQQATKELQVVYKDPAIIQPLCDILCASQNAQMRQYSAVLLRKKLVKTWKKKLPPELRSRIKATLLQCLTQEKQHLVLRSVAHTVSVIARHEFSLGTWPELNQFILEHCNSPDPGHRETGLLLLSSLMDTAASQFQPQFPQLLQLFSAALDDGANKMVPFYALKSLTAMVEHVGSEESPVFQSMIPKIMTVINALIEQDEDKACEAMELFDELVECDVGIVVPHLPSLIQFCLNLGSNLSLGDSIRVKALSFVSWLVTLKKKTLLKHNLLPSILVTMLKIMASHKEGEEEDDEEDLQEETNQSQSPTTLAAQVLDTLALYLPPDKIFTPVLQLLEPWFRSADPFQRSASLIAVAVITEGCSEFIRNNHLKTVLDIAYGGIKDDHRNVRNSALFAIGQFAEHLQPEIGEYHGELMPVLFQFMDTAIQHLQQQHQPSVSHRKTGLTKIFYAIETFGTQLGAGLLPYLDPLMQKLFLILSSTQDIHVQELVISGFSAAAEACEDKMLPYFPKIIEVLKQIIAAPYHQDRSILQAQAIDALGTLARTIGQEHFRHLSVECVELGMNLMHSNDPDLRKSVYGMFSSVSGILKEEMAPHLGPIIARMVESLITQEGITVHNASFEVSFLDFEDEDDDGEGEGAAGGGDNMDSIEDDDAVEGYSVENAYLEEKEDTCNALGEMAEHLGPSFLPYLDNCFREVNILSEESHEGIRKAAIWALSRFCKVWYRCAVNSDDADSKANMDVLVNNTLGSMAATVRTDSDRSVVTATLEAVEDLLKALEPLSFPMQERVLSSLVVSVQDILEDKAQCQGEEEEEEGALPGEDMAAEYDTVLVEVAGSILGPLAAVAGGERFLSLFEQVLTKLLAKLTGPNSTVADKSFTVGTLAEVVEGVGGYARLLLNLYQVFVEYSGSQQDDEVCSNSIYGLGVLAANALPDMASNYPAILQHLFVVNQTRTNNCVKDNVTAAVSRMIMASQDSVPLDQVVPVLLQGLPLKEDMEENETVFKCIVKLITAKNPVIMSHLQVVLKIFAFELSSQSRLSKDLQLELVRVVQVLSRECPEQMQVASSSLTQEELAVLTSALQLSTVINGAS